MFIADLHIHSKYSRATSINADLDGYSKWAGIKGMAVLGTGDFTHPKWLKELKGKMFALENGLFEYEGTKFILTAEVSNIFEAGKIRKVHTVVLAPSFELVEQFNDEVKKFGNLSEDGRPVLKMSLAELADVVSKLKDVYLIPAHAWTPWFGVFGSKTGFDSVEEAFDGKTERIIALETGLSSDPMMNWMVSRIDKYSLVSNSDCHSPQKLGREANVFDCEMSYTGIVNAIKTRKGFVKTYEFYPEEGKYHYDGHRNCGVVMHPEEAMKNKNICPVCRRTLTIGVLHRVYELADRKYGFKPENAVPFQHIVPLQTIVSKALKKPETSRLVQEACDKIIQYFGNEFNVYEAKEDAIKLATSPEIADAIIRVNNGEVKWMPGYDGVFGELVLGKTGSETKKQKSLMDF
ncbi:MAG: endonuclease Q family protein [Candidatus Micrarchaeia archaeon]